MPPFSKSSRRLTPLQLVLAVVLVLAGAAYELLHQPSGSPGSPGSQDTPGLPVAPTWTADLPAASAAPLARAKQPIPTRAASAAATPGGDFDYFVLALSWSPDYCSANAANDPQQCAVGKKLGFVLHGLWPQYTQGYPSSCGSEPLPAGVKADFAGLYPNDNLFEHEWSKHGTCSGLDARAYLELTRQIQQSVAIPAAYQSPPQPFRASPAQLKQVFEQENPGFEDETLAVNCSGSGRYLKELYVCFAKDGPPAACGADVRKDALKSCSSPDFLVRSSR